MITEITKFEDDDLMAFIGEHRGDEELATIAGSLLLIPAAYRYVSYKAAILMTHAQPDCTVAQAVQHYAGQYRRDGDANAAKQALRASQSPEQDRPVQSDRVLFHDGGCGHLNPFGGMVR